MRMTREWARALLCVCVVVCECVCVGYVQECVYYKICIMCTGLYLSICMYVEMCSTTNCFLFCRSLSKKNHNIMGFMPKKNYIHNGRFKSDLRIARKGHLWYTLYQLIFTNWDKIFVSNDFSFEWMLHSSATISLRIFLNNLEYANDSLLSQFM